MIDAEDIQFILANVPFERIRQARVLITGGSGFIGHWLSVVPDYVTVRALNREQYEFGKWDHQEWDYIFHLANVHPKRVIDCARRCHAPILFSSSGAIYDAEPSAYSTGKMLAETALLESGCDVKIARMYSFAGAHMKNHFALINYIYDALSGGPIKIRGDNVIRSYMYAADMAIWLWRIMLNGRKNSIYEVGSSHPVDMWYLATVIGGQFLPKIKITEERIFGPDARPYYVPRAEELARTKRDFGLDEWTPFTSAVSKTLVHYQDELEGVTQ